MNNYKQGRIFNQALNEADTRSTDMSAEDWARMCGLMHDYGHGYLFEEFTKGEAIKKIEAIAEELELEAEMIDNIDENPELLEINDVD